MTLVGMSALRCAAMTLAGMSALRCDDSRGDVCAALFGVTASGIVREGLREALRTRAPNYQKGTLLWMPYEMALNQTWGTTTPPPVSAKRPPPTPVESLNFCGRWMDKGIPSRFLTDRHKGFFALWRDHQGLWWKQPHNSQVIHYGVHYWEIMATHSRHSICSLTNGVDTNKVTDLAALC
ncbi:hypothetical protein CYMTET_53973 [Cymbomonas tetramitiformis]|uniref:Uncharacterized protein n=1 Tax=Cymbomonas tetramitiformis TaxID=36881 RepID=A0AAE0EQ25_9CHLO|nr:hypothetical protein CYMTET_53973 [Cymbomonas tetramitiformis]